MILECNDHLFESKLYFAAKILDLRTFFNDSEKKAFILMTNGTRIFKAKFLIGDETNQKAFRNKDEGATISGFFEDLNTAAASFR